MAKLFISWCKQFPARLIWTRPLPATQIRRRLGERRVGGGYHRCMCQFYEKCRCQRQQKTQGSSLIILFPSCCLTVWFPHGWVVMFAKHGLCKLKADRAQIHELSSLLLLNSVLDRCFERSLIPLVMGLNSMQKRMEYGTGKVVCVLPF
jgi:hypothetical protein